MIFDSCDVCDGLDIDELAFEFIDYSRRWNIHDFLEEYAYRPNHDFTEDKKDV